MLDTPRFVGALSVHQLLESEEKPSKQVVTQCFQNVGCWAKATLKELEQISSGNGWEFDVIVP